MSLPAPLVVSPAVARLFLLRTLGLETPFPTLPAALAHHGYIQIDPINICGRMHDLILRNRVAGYREGDLHRYLHSPARPGFEHYLPSAARPHAPTGVLVAFPIEAWPYLAGLITSRRLRGGVYGRKLSPKGERIAQHILSEIAQRGPLTSDEIEHEGTSLTAWGTPGRLVKNILEILFVHGRVLITQRRNFRRVYDLPERVLPAAVLSAPQHDARAAARWLVLARLRQRRLVTLKREDLKLVLDAVQPVSIAGCPPLYCLREDAGLFAAIENRESKIVPSSPERHQTNPQLLAPLDPIIYDRRLTSALWNFDYTWEVYTPPPKRVRGYYALPVLAGTELVGHVDPKADRPGKKLVVISRRIRRGHQVAASVRELARWLGLR